MRTPAAKGAPGPAAEAEGMFAPFRHRAFAVLWTATVVSNVGTWMNEVGAGWLMTTLAPDPATVALVQAATTLPLFLLAMPAGALADIVDRRRMLMAVQVLMAGAALALGLLTAAGAMTPARLLALTFVLGIGAALAAPAWQAIVPQLVPRGALGSAVAMNSVGINVSRAVGPALAGSVIAAFGLAWPFLINAASFLGVIAALAWWRLPPRPAKPLPAERWAAAMRTGLRYARSSPALRATLVRALAFFAFASAYWALLPLVVRQQLGGGAPLYGAMMASVGVGAVAAAFALPRLKAAWGADRLVAAGTLGTALVLAVFAAVASPAAGLAAGLLAGACWVAVLSSLNVSAQTALPDWVRARGLAVFIAVFFGAMAGGSVLWGQVASAFGIPAALLIAAAGAVVGVAATRGFALQQGAALDLAPSAHWPAPLVAESVDPDRGPVMVTIEYRVAPEDRAAFLGAIRALSGERRRDGAVAWGVYEDAEAPGRFVETFVEASWLDHLRHHERVTVADRDLQAAVVRYHRGDEPPRVRHLIAADEEGSR